LTRHQAHVARTRIGAIDETQPYLLCLQDPADPLNDLGRKAFGFKHIKQTIVELHRRLLKLEKVPVDSDISWLDDFVGPCYDAYKGRRAIAEAFGRTALASLPAVESSASNSASLSVESDVNVSVDPNGEGVLRDRLRDGVDLQQVHGVELAQHDELELKDEPEHPNVLEQKDEPEQKKGDRHPIGGPQI
jgi:DNA polymerase sigma